MTSWQVHSAKAKFSELLERAEKEGPQIILKRRSERAVVLSIEDYRKLTAAQPDLRDYLLGGPKVDGLDLERSSDTGRELDW